MAHIWITVGSALKDYARVAGVPSGEPSYSSVARFRDRLAHQMLDRLDVEIVWDTSVNRTSTLASWIEQLLAALEGADPDRE